MGFLACWVVINVPEENHWRLSRPPLGHGTDSDRLGIGRLCSRAGGRCEPALANSRVSNCRAGSGKKSKEEVALLLIVPSSSTPRGRHSSEAMHPPRACGRRTRSTHQGWRDTSPCVSSGQGCGGGGRMRTLGWRVFGLQGLSSRGWSRFEGFGEWGWGLRNPKPCHP